MNKIRKLEKWGVKWLDCVNLDTDKKKDILKNYNFHELDVESCLEENQFTKVNKNKDYIFIILDFPKYISNRWIYVKNEFNIFLWKNFILTFRDYHSSHVDKIFNMYKNMILEEDKINPGYILYKVIEVMLEKAYNVIHKQRQDLSNLENIIFDSSTTYEVKHILIKKRNIILLKHIFQPQTFILRQLENALNLFFKWEYELYFEDLQDKIDFIVHKISILHERIENIEDAFRNIVDIKLNRLIAILTIFSAFMLPLTLITSFYGMNISLPFQNKPEVVYGLLIFSGILMLIFIWYFIEKK